MSKQEQKAILAFCNSFRLSKRVTSFEQLSDGKVLLEVMSHVDGSHFKTSTPRSGPSSPDNWVLKTNALKRLYRLLLSYGLPPPHPSSLSQTSLPEPAFSTVSKNAQSKEGTEGLLQIARFCLTIAVWAPGNEKVITRIQAMEEGTMAELMQSIEEVMRTLPAERGSEEDTQAGKIGSPRGGSGPSRAQSRQPSPIKLGSGATSPTLTKLREERDKLLNQNDELRVKLDKLADEMKETADNLKEVEQERDDALVRLTGPDASVNLRTSQTAASEMQRLRADLSKAETELSQREVELEKQVQKVYELNARLEQLNAEAAEVPRMRDQLDEYRHMADRLQKSENVIEKYKTKLEEQAGLRKELKVLERENASLVHANAGLQAESRKMGSAVIAGGEWRDKVEAAERLADQRAAEITEMAAQLESIRSQMLQIELTHERDKEELQMYQERLKEMELRSSPTTAARSTIPGVGGSLSEELNNGDAGPETKAELRSQIRTLGRQIDTLEASARRNNRIPELEKDLASVTKLRDRYKTDYAASHRAHMKVEADLERIRSGRGADSSMTLAALKQGFDDTTAERDDLVKSRAALDLRVEQLEIDLRVAQAELSLVDKDQTTMLAGMRESIEREHAFESQRVILLREELDALKDKDRLHLEQIKRLLSEKLDLQTVPTSPGGLPPEIFSQLASAQEKQRGLLEELQEMRERVHVAEAGSRGDFGEAQRAYEAQIERLKQELEREKKDREEMEERYAGEQRLMLGAWHELGSRVVREHVNQASSGIKRPVRKAEMQGWLGRQRRAQEDAIFGGGR